jgi:tetratricopeptide (TPR) repeat protein
MKRRNTVSIVAAACVALCLTASVLTLRRVDQLRPRATIEEVLYVSSPKVLKRASLGYDGLLADIYWTRAVQYFGQRHWDYAMSYDLLYPLLNITTQLDPHLIVAYQFGASFLAPKPPDGAGRPKEAVDLLQFGIKNNPDIWKLYYDLGFIYYMNLKDPKKAAEVFQRGSQAANAHPFLRLLSAQMAEHAGDYNTARLMWSATYSNTQDKLIRENALEHLRDSHVEEDVTRLQQAVTRFGDRTGRLPVSMQELIDAEGLISVPIDPDGNPYRLTPRGLVVVQVPQNFPFAEKGLPPGFKPVPKFHIQEK